MQPEVANRPRASALPLQPEAAEAQQAGASLRQPAAAEPPRRAVAALPQAAEPPQPEVAEPPQPEEAEPLWVSALSQPEAAGPPQQREASPEAPPAVWTIRIEVANPLRVTCSRVPSRFGALRAHAPHDERTAKMAAANSSITPRSPRMGMSASRVGAAKSASLCKASVYQYAGEKWAMACMVGSSRSRTPTPLPRRTRPCPQCCPRRCWRTRPRPVARAGIPRQGEWRRTRATTPA